MENLIRPLREPVPAEDDDGVGEDGPGGAEGDRVHGAKRQLDLPQFPRGRKKGGLEQRNFKLLLSLPLHLLELAKWPSRTLLPLAFNLHMLQKRQ